MSVLNDKKFKWYESVQKGDSRYLMLKHDKNKWYFIGNNYTQEINSLKVAVDRGEGMQLKYAWESQMSIVSDICFAAIIKDDKKLIAEDENGTYTFGIKSIEPIMKSIFIYIRTKNMHCFVFGSSESNSAKMFFELADDEKDAVTNCMDSLFPSRNLSVAIIKGEEHEV